VTDEAPRSTRRVERALSRVDLLTDDELVKMTVTTRVQNWTHEALAETTVSRPVLRDANEQSALDHQIMAALRKLPGANPGIPMTMGREFTVTWDGIRRPA
jgi:hypothetical protein